MYIYVLYELMRCPSRASPRQFFWDPTRPFTTLSIALAAVLRPSIPTPVPTSTAVLDTTWTVSWR